MNSLNRILRLGVVAFLVAVGALHPQAQAKTLRVAISGFPNLGFNPLTLGNAPALYTFAAMFDALTLVDPGGVAKPQLAESWRAVDQTTWHFKLRPGVSFSNGEALTAESVAFVINLMKSPLGQTYSTSAEVSSIRNARAVDRLTVEITTTEPNPFLPQELSLIRILSPAQWTKAGVDGFNQAPVGSGPFVLEKASPGRLILAAAASSWRKPLVDRLELLAVPEPAARLQALLSGNADISIQLGPDEIAAVESAGHRMVIQPDGAMIVLAFITTKDSPLKDVRVRRALNYAVNKDDIVNGILSGHARVASQTASSIAFGYDPQLKPYPYDPEEARRLLADAGYPNGFSIVAETFSGNASYAPLVYQRVSADLAKVGIKLEIHPVPIAKYGRGLFQGEWEGTAFGVDYNAAPSFDALRAFHRHSCLWRAPWYCDPSIMPLLNEALATFDLDTRRALTQQVLAHPRDQAPGILLHDNVRFDGVSRAVKNFAVTAGYIPYDAIDIAK